MADDKKNILEAALPTEAPAPAVENAAVSKQFAPESVLTDAEAVMLEHGGASGDPIGAIWGCMGYSVLLCFCLFKTGSIARSVFSAH